MRRLTVAVLTVAGFTWALATSPVLASPRAAATYRGHGQDFFNNGPHWKPVPGAGQPISFTVSKDGAHVLHFRGKYAYYCGHGTSTITAASLKINHGRFGGTGKRANANGTNYFALNGRFSADGHTATIAYLDDFVYKGKSAQHPYSFAYHPSAQTCESRVTATVSTG